MQYSLLHWLHLLRELTKYIEKLTARIMSYRKLESQNSDVRSSFRGFQLNPRNIVKYEYPPFTIWKRNNIRKWKWFQHFKFNYCFECISWAWIVSVRIELQLSLGCLKHNWHNAPDPFWKWIPFQAVEHFVDLSKLICYLITSLTIKENKTKCIECSRK